MRDFVTFITAHIELPNAARILDIGAGRGADARFFLERSNHVTAIDLCCAVELSAMAQEFGARMTYRQGNFLDLDVAPRSFSLALDNGCFHHQHADQLRPYLTKVQECLSENGVFALNVFCEKLAPGCATITMADGRLVHVHDEATLRSALCAAGFDHIEFKRTQRREAELDYDYLYVLAHKRTAQHGTDSC